MEIVANAPVLAPVKRPGRHYDKVFFLVMTLLLLVIALIGFGRSYYLAGVFHAPLPAPILHVHGALNTLWMILLVVQAGLVSAKRIRWHMTLGIFGFCLALTMVVVGFIVSANQVHRYQHDSHFDVLSFETIPFIEEVCFAVLAGFAFALRRKAAAHKRLILLATIAMMGAALSRFPGQNHNGTLAEYGMYGLLVVMMAYDLWALRTIHLATVLGSALIVAYMNLAAPIGHTAPWHRFALWMQSLQL
jgi:hypothetical protein